MELTNKYETTHACREFEARWIEAHRIKIAERERRERNRQQAARLRIDEMTRREQLSASEQKLLADKDAMERIRSAPFIETIRNRRALIKDRLENGFRHHGGDVAGRYYEPFREEGLRSLDDHNLMRIVHNTPKADNLLSGKTKEFLDGTDSKLLALDDPYIELNKNVRLIFRVDMDTIFESWDELGYELKQLPLACVPHLGCGYVDKAGKVIRPHVFVILPYDSGVWWDKTDPRCRPDIMNLWTGVHRGITKILLPLGADPGGLSNPLRIKNPISPFFSYHSFNSETYLNLSEWAAWVDTHTSPESLVRDSAEKLSGLGKKISNELFTYFQTEAYETLRKWHQERNPDYLASINRNNRERLDELLFSHLVKQTNEITDHPKQAKAILYRVTAYAAAHWDSKKVDKDGRKDRGACRHLLSSTDSLHDKQRSGALFSHQQRTDRTFSKLHQAINMAKKNNIPVNVSTISSLAKMTRKTVRKYWNEIQ
ncbi:hypothetical protein V5F53_02730 [Xanthobacter sp. V4C-4]|uniref:hypothetical protein n=1 Tax=Xanthobacter cornucopiae TaxID=3119924 RepID=UPI003727EA94